MLSLGEAAGGQLLPPRVRQTGRTPRIVYSNVKRRLRELLQRWDCDGLVALAVEKRRVLGLLTSLTFDAEPLIAWRAVEAMGLAAARIAEDDPEYVRDHLRRLLWLLSDESGGVCWRAPEAMAEIVRRKPELFAEYIPIVVSLITSLAEEDLDRFRPGVLWAIGRLGSLAGEHVEPVVPSIVSALDHPTPQVRGIAAWCLERVGRTRFLAQRSNMLSDEGQVELYEDGSLIRARVCDLVRPYVGDESAEG